MPFRYAILLLVSALQPLPAEVKPFAFGSVRFEQNRGQSASAVRYIARARGEQMFFTDEGVVLSPEGGTPVRMSFAGAQKAQWVPLGETVDSISYYIGKDPAKWVKSAPVYDRVAWRGVYPGVDVVFYGNGDSVEYDLTLAPGADPSRIRLKFSGAARVCSRADGSIEIAGVGAVIRQRAPRIDQEIAPGKRANVPGRFVTAGPGTVRLKIGRYERSKPLLVDPVIEAVTYLGGENDDEIVALADGFVAGNTRSLSFPGASPAFRRSRDIFLRGTGYVIPSQLTRLTFFGTVVFGGSGDDELSGIVSSTTYSAVYLAGTTNSTDLPGTLLSPYRGGRSDGFITTVNVFGTFGSINNTLYVGGSGEDRITALVGNDFTQVLAGITDSPDLAVGDVPQKRLAGGKDAFYGVGSVASGLTYGYLGGSGDDAAYAATMRSSRSVWIGGETRSPDFPFNEPGLAGASDAFLTEITGSFASTVPGLNLSTFRLGGSGEDSIRALAGSAASITSGIGGGQVLVTATIDGIGIAGTTSSPDLPLRKAAQAQFGGEKDAFAGWWDPAAGALKWLTYLGGSGADEATSIARNWGGDLYVGGWTRSPDFPVVDALQPLSAGGEDGMLAILDIDGNLLQATYFGGSGDDRIRDVRLIFNSVARLAGSTTSTDLPQRQAWQERGQRSEGFVADIGTDQLIGPSELILAKDGLLNLSLRLGRTAYREPVTYQSSDPSRVRLVFLGRSYDSVTAAAEDNISLEALGDSGEVEITATAAGSLTKKIRVKLYPGAFIPSINSGTFSFSTWSSATLLSANYRAIDPASGQPVGFGLLLRPGAGAPVIRWSVSDSTVFELIGNQIRPLRAGEALLTLTVDGYAVLTGNRVVTVSAPRPQPPDSDIRLGRDLQTNLSLTFAVNGFFLNSGYRGTLTARSGDPSRLLVSANPEQAGRESATITMSNGPPVIYVQALAGDGTVQVFFTSSEFEGEVPIRVVLEPTLLRWGGERFVSNQNTIEPAVALLAGQERFPLSFSLQGESGSFSGGLRPGAPALTMTLANSDPRIVELNRLTTTFGANFEAYRLRALSPGASELTLSLSNSTFRLVNRTVRVDVQPAAGAVPTFASSVWIGKDLQIFLTFRYSTGEEVTVTSDDPAAVLVSPSSKTLGSGQVNLRPENAGSDEYRLYLQASKSQGETRVRVRFPGAVEKEIKVILLPSGAGFAGLGLASPNSGFDQGARLAAWALDDESGVGVAIQIPQPGPGIEVRLRTEGAPIRLARESVVLTAESANPTVDFTVPPAGKETTLIAETGSNFSTSVYIGRLTVRGPIISAVPVDVGNLLLARDEIREYSLPSTTFQSVGQSPLTVTSTDPGRVLLSTSPRDPGFAVINSILPSSRIYIHALTDSGSAVLRFETAEAAPRELKVALQPLRLNVFGGSVALGSKTDYTASLNASVLRSGVGPYRVNVRSADDSVATVRPPFIDLAGASGITSGTFQATGVTAGNTQLIFDGPPEIFIVPSQLSISVVPAQNTVAAYTLGKNLQASTVIDLGSEFTNPNGAIVTITSSDPGRLLLSRSLSTPGAASVTVAVPAGDRRTQALYFQGINEGDVTLQMTSSGGTRQVATVRVTASWLNCGTQPLTIQAGVSQTASCFFRFTSTPNTALSDVTVRAGLEGAAARLSSSAPEVFTVTPQALSLQSGPYNFTVRAVAAGSAELRIELPAGFGPVPDGSDTLSVRVVQPSLSTFCKELTIGKDTQFDCAFTVPAGVAVTATSQNPALLIVSSDAKVAGTTTVTKVAANSGVTFTLQALAAFGTAEAVFSAPGYQDFRIAAAMRPTELYLSSSGAPSALTLQKGSVATLTVALRVDFSQALPRAGVSIPVDFSATPQGIITFDSARVTLGGQQESAQVLIRGTSVGSALIRMTGPEGYPVVGTPMAASVVP